MSSTAAATSAAASTGAPEAIVSGVAAAAAASEKKTETAATTTETAKPVAAVEAKPAEAAKPAEPVKAEEPKKPEVQAEFKIKLPDGAVIDEARLAKFTEIAKKHGLSSEAASEAVAFQLQESQADIANWTKRGEQWAVDAKKDPAAYQNQLKAIRKYGGAATGADSNELTDALNELGVFYHPAIHAFASRIGAAMKEDSTDTGGGKPAPAELSQEQKLARQYPSMFNADGSRKQR